MMDTRTFDGDSAAPSRAGLAHHTLRYRLSPLDCLVHCANALLLGAVFWTRAAVPHAAWFAGAHVMLGVLVSWLAWRTDPKAPGFDPVAFAHHWLPAIIIVLMYFELGLLIPSTCGYIT